MKRMVAILITGSAIASASYAANTASSANIVGYVRHELPPNGKILVGVNFTANGRSPTLKELLGNQLRAAANPSEADRVMIWDPKISSYQIYARNSKTGEFYPCTSEQWLGSIPANPLVPAGTGFWVVSAAGSSATNTIYISGDVTDGPPVDFDLQSHSQMVTNSFPTEASISVLTERFHPQTGDMAAVWSGSFYTNYRLSENGNWTACAAKSGSTVETVPVIPAGKAFWFIRTAPANQSKDAF